MSTRNIPPRVLAIIAELRSNGEHEEADLIEAGFGGAGGGTTGPTTEQIHAQAQADVAVIEATADATEQVIGAQADAAAEVLEAEDNTDDENEDGEEGDLADGASPEEAHWYFKNRRKA